MKVYQYHTDYLKLIMKKTSKGIIIILLFAYFIPNLIGQCEKVCMYLLPLTQGQLL